MWMILITVCFSILRALKALGNGTDRSHNDYDTIAMIMFCKVGAASFQWLSGAAERGQENLWGRKVENERLKL